ncbi:MAG: hypothetical protein ACUVYA_13240 [Planctomycetota bacterium]
MRRVVRGVRKAWVRALAAALLAVLGAAAARAEEEVELPARARVLVRRLPVRVRTVARIAEEPSAPAKAEVEPTAEEGEAKAEPEEAKAEEKAPAGEEEPGEGAEAEAPKAPAPPPQPVVRLREQTRLAGDIDVEALHVTTAYGPLVIPVSDVLRVRFAQGKKADVDDQVDVHIAALGSDEFDAREQAVEKLREIGLPALEKLRKAAASEDPEVKARAEKLVAELEELVEDDEEDEDLAVAKPLTGSDDEIVTAKFTVKGRVEESRFVLKTRWGRLELSRDDVVSIVFRTPERVVTKVTIPGTAFAATNKWVRSDVEVAEGERLRIRASGTINLENYGQTVGPEGTTNIGGNQFQNFPTGSLVARIGEKGEPFQVGAEFDGPANASGKLEFAVSLQSGQARGSFQVEVEREVGK